MIGKCQCCEQYKEQVKYLQGLLDRTLNLIAPKLEEPVDPKLESPEDERESITFGQG